MQNQPGEKRCQVKVLVFAASLRRDSYNKRLATLAAKVVEEQGGTVDHASMPDFDCPPYDGELQASTGIPANAPRLREPPQAVRASHRASPPVSPSRSPPPPSSRSGAPAAHSSRCPPLGPLRTLPSATRRTSSCSPGSSLTP